RRDARTQAKPRSVEIELARIRDERRFAAVQVGDLAGIRAKPRILPEGERSEGLTDEPRGATEHADEHQMDEHHRPHLSRCAALEPEDRPRAHARDREM